MSPIHQFLLYLHIALGSCALIVFWIPVFTKKGNLDHKRFGRYFARTMYGVAGSGLIMSSLDLLFPLQMHAVGLEFTPARAAEAVIEVRSFALFLFSLSILVLTNTRQGWLVILHKADRTALRTPFHIGLCLSLAVVGVVLLITGLIQQSLLFIVFSLLQIANGIESLRYNFKAELAPKQWWIEHLRGLIGSGIGAYTAFFVFGGRRIFDGLFGSGFEGISIILWVAPGVVGGVAIAMLSRHYTRRFNGTWAKNRAAVRTNLGNLGTSK